MKPLLLSVKFLLWQRGGNIVTIDGPRPLTQALQSMYSAQGTPAFDSHLLGESIFGAPLAVRSMNSSLAATETSEKNRRSFPP